MRIWYRPFFTGVLKGDGAMQQVFEGHLRCLPNFQEEYGSKKFLYGCFLTHDEVFIVSELRFFNRYVGQFEIRNSRSGIDLEWHEILHRRIIEMFGYRAGARHQ